MSVRARSGFAGLLLICLFFSGCGLPLYDSHSYVSAVYPRVDQNGKTNEIIIVAHSSSAWVTLSVDGGRTLGNGYTGGTRYFYSDRHWRRRSLPFLQATNDAWETFVPVEGTNRWVRVEGSSQYAFVNHIMTNMTLTVFTLQHPLYHQTIPLTDLPRTNHVRFLEGNHIVVYKSESDAFLYNVMENTISQPSVK